MRKTKLPTQFQTKLSTCPRCSKPKFHRVLLRCKNCKLILTPNKEKEIRTALNIFKERYEKKS